MEITKTSNSLTRLILLTIGFTLNALIVMAGQGYQVGDQATDFELKNIDGRMVSCSSIEEAKGYVIIFTCNHCPFSKMYEDRIIALSSKFTSKGWPVIAINPNDSIQYPEDSYASMKIRAAEKGFNFPYLYDETQEVAKRFGAMRTPHVFILDKELVVQYIGAIDDNAKSATNVNEKYIEAAINHLEAGTAVDPSHTKAIGCSIKWKL